MTAGGEFALRQAIVRAATTLEQVRVICDRTHEENILAARDGRSIELATHYAYAMGTVMYVALQELDKLQRELGIRHAELHDEANARASASLDQFKRQVRAIDLELQRKEGA